MYDISLAGNYRRDVEGGYLIEGVTILAEGVWNGTPYTAIELAKAATKWRDNTVWNRHYDDKSRDETNRVGMLKNQHFSYDRIVSDVFLSNSTPEGREMIELVKNDEINGISVEHIDKTVNGISTEISFLGAAIVPVPGCSICQLNKGENYMDEEELNKLKGTVAELAKSVEDGNTDKLQESVTELAADVKALKGVDVDAVVKEQSEKDAKTISGMETRIKELEAMEVRLKKLEDEPVTSLAKDSDIEDTYAEIVISKDGINRRT
jgi:hypothetical protein